MTQTVSATTDVAALPETLRPLVATMAPKTIAREVSLRTGLFRIQASEYGPAFAGPVVAIPPLTHAASSEPEPAFEICFADDCGELLGSPWCCDKRPTAIAAYEAAVAAHQARQQ